MHQSSARAVYVSHQNDRVVTQFKTPLATHCTIHTYAPVLSPCSVICLTRMTGRGGIVTQFKTPLATHCTIHTHAPVLSPCSVMCLTRMTGRGGIVTQFKTPLATHCTIHTYAPVLNPCSVHVSHQNDRVRDCHTMQDTLSNPLHYTHTCTSPQPVQCTCLTRMTGSSHNSRPP